MEIRNIENKLYFELNEIGNLLGYKRFAKNVQDRKCKYKEAYMVVENIDGVRSVSEEIVLKFISIRLKKLPSIELMGNIERIIAEMEEAKAPKVVEILGHKGFFVNKEGKIFDSNMNEVEERINHAGYREAQLSYGKWVLVHRIVAHSFCENNVDVENEGFASVHHKDCNKLNCSANNLLWMGRKKHNALHFVWRGLRRKGLSEAEIFEVVAKDYYVA